MALEVLDCLGQFAARIFAPKSIQLRYLDLASHVLVAKRVYIMKKEIPSHPIDPSALSKTPKKTETPISVP